MLAVEGRLKWMSMPNARMVGVCCTKSQLSDMEIATIDSAAPEPALTGLLMSRINI